MYNSNNLTITYNSIEYEYRMTNTGHNIPIEVCVSTTK